MRLPAINLDLVATVGAVAAVGLAVLIIGSAVPGVSRYLLYIIFPVMAVPVVIYAVPLVLRSRSGRAEGMRSSQPASPPVEMTLSGDAPAAPDAPSQPPAARPSEAPIVIAEKVSSEELTQFNDRLNKMESELLQVIQLSGAILEKVTSATPVQVAAPQPQPSPRSLTARADSA